MLLRTAGPGPRSERVRPLLPFALLAVVGFVVFTSISDAVGEHDGPTLADVPVSLWFAAHRTLAEGHLGLLIATATSPAALVALVAVTAALLWRRGFRLESTLLAVATLVAYGVGGAVKYADHRARPSSPVNLSPESEPSFPSGHVLVVATVALVVLGLAWAHLSRRARAVAVAAAVVAVALVSVDRLVVGAHWLTDVVGSLALAAVVAALVLAGHHLLRTPSQPPSS